MPRATRGRTDKILMLSVIAIAVLGVVFLYSATYEVGVSEQLDPLVVKQAIWVLAGLVLMFAIAHSDYNRILDFSYLLYALNLGALLYILLFGSEHYGARRWIDLGPVSIQPSEFMKITVIFVLASFLGARREKIGTLSNFFLSLLLVSPAFLLIFLQPDLGTSLVIVPILFAILFICGEKVKYILSVFGIALASLPFLWGLLKDYQKARLMVFLNPDIDPLGAGYTIIQSKIAIGSGGLLGKGWLNGTQSYLKFLPERHTDFIFSVIGEEWGFVGGVFLLSLYCVYIARGIRIISLTQDVYARAIATGVIVLVAFQVLVNISMTIGFMPVVGLPLPAISYGGSNTITTLIGAGFLLSISRKVVK
ncbi:MAG: rod shape-determining protein RodA [Candidatus Omnitrophica bacterium]|nr:rod shape-determining protein RodA [Candidatus Omnitrophota bacterium]